jgi:hypothetical protein
MMRDIAVAAELVADMTMLRHELRMMELRRQLDGEIEKGRVARRRLFGAWVFWMVGNAITAFGAMFGLAKLVGH